jgi:ribonuclease G
VDIGIGKNGFLQLKDSEGPRKSDSSRRQRKSARSAPDEFKVGKEIMVQVVKEEIGSKGVRLDTNLSLPGRFLVLMPRGQGKIHISRKIVNKEHRDYLRDKVISKMTLPENVDVIIRTAAAGVKAKFINRDLDALLKTWKRIQSEIKTGRKIRCVHEELDLVRKIVRDWLDENVERIFIDDKTHYERLKNFIKKHLANPKVKLRLYRGDIDIFDKFGVTRQIEKLYEKKVWLKCGGSIVIDRTEALVAIDVNTGKNIKHSNSEETIRETNLEAGEQIARQLRLRNMGGIVVIDFIDMKSKNDQREVLRHLQKHLEKDKAKSKIYPFTRLGLVQMTRQRVEDSWEQHYFVDCVRCGGSGRILSVPVIGDQIVSRIKRFLVLHPGIDLNVKANSEIVDFLLETKCFERIEKQFRIEIGYLKDENFHPENYLVVRRDSGSNIFSKS